MGRLLSFLERLFTRDWTVNCSTCRRDFTVPRARVIELRAGRAPITGKCDPCRKSNRKHYREWQQYRTRVHALFDQVWRDGYMTREVAYNWLATIFKRPFQSVHLSDLSREELEKVEQAVQARFPHIT